MSAHSQASDALDNQAFALMSRMHVLLRREIGHVTDIKYMSISPEYCRHVFELAEDVANPDLREICQKLEQIYFGEKGIFEFSAHKYGATRPRKVAPALSSRVSVPVDAVATIASLNTDTVLESGDQHYVGRLR